MLGGFSLQRMKSLFPAPFNGLIQLPQTLDRCDPEMSTAVGSRLWAYLPGVNGVRRNMNEAFVRKLVQTSDPTRNPHIILAIHEDGRHDSRYSFLVLVEKTSLQTGFRFVYRYDVVEGSYPQLAWGSDDLRGKTKPQLRAQ
jgi:hypothetical protein